MRIFHSLIDFFVRRRQQRQKDALEDLKARYHAFRIYLENYGRALELIVTVNGQLMRGEERHLRTSIEELLVVTRELVDGLNLLSGSGHAGLSSLHGRMASGVTQLLDVPADTPVEKVYCIQLDELDQDAYLLAGAKAANLARLRHRALPVPNGFVITTEACKDYLTIGKLAGSIRQLLHNIEHDYKDINIVASKIREMILSSPLPEEIGMAMENCYNLLVLTQNVAGQPVTPIAVSVRSSGVSEDGTDHSFAGQFTSILNIIGSQQLQAAYKEVIAGGFSARAISYRLNAGLSPVDFDLAVLCQVMVVPHCAGVMLTRDPSQPESGRMLISAVPGLGTMAVDGSAPVDIYHPWRRSRTDEVKNPASSKDLSEQIMDGAHIPDKTVREVAIEGGGICQEQLPTEEAALPLLSVESLAELLHFGEIIENLAGMPQDIEWAYTKNGEMTILQARPLHLAAGTGQRIRLSPVDEPLMSGTCASSEKAMDRVQRVHPIQENSSSSNTISPERQQLRDLVVPLNLADTCGPTFSIMECRSIHDIIRYTHEMAVLAMFDVGDQIMDKAGSLLRRLEIGVPFDFLVIDVGGGIRRDSNTLLQKRSAVHKPLNKDDILSIPLAAFCEGLLTPGLSWRSGPETDAPSDKFSRAQLDTRTARPSGSINYAIADRDYLNLNAREEFHFAMLDAVCGRDSHANYIRIRFKGGGVGFQRDGRRAIFLRHILENNSFYTTAADDLITASLVGASKEVVYERLIMLGRLMGFSRLLDGVMTDDSTPLELAQAFLDGRFDSISVTGQEFL